MVLCKSDLEFDLLTLFLLIVYWYYGGKLFRSSSINGYNIFLIDIDSFNLFWSTLGVTDLLFWKSSPIFLFDINESLRSWPLAESYRAPLTKSKAAPQSDFLFLWKRGVSSLLSDSKTLLYHSLNFLYLASDITSIYICWLLKLFA